MFVQGAVIIVHLDSCAHRQQRSQLREREGKRERERCSNPSAQADQSVRVMPPRFAGDGGKILEIICRRAAVPDFLPYGDFSNCKTEPKKILAQREMWQQLRVEHPSLSFPQSVLEIIMEQVAGEKASEWNRPLDAAEVKDFKARMARRMRAQSRHICQALIKNPNTAWLLQLFPAASSSVAAPSGVLVTKSEQ